MIPSLLNPVMVTILPPDTSATVMDPLSREPIRKIKPKTPVRLEAQVAWGRSGRQDFRDGAQGGSVIESEGYLVFLVADIKALATPLKANDRVSAIGDRTGEWYLTAELLAGMDEGSNTLAVWDFSNKALAGG